MRILSKIFRGQVETVKESAFLNPWYFKKYQPHLTQNGRQLTWKSSGDGTSILKGNGPLGIVKMYSYIQPNLTGERFLIWHRSAVKDAALPTLTFCLYSTCGLLPIEQIDETMANIKAEKKTCYYFNGKPEAKLTLQLDTDQCEQKFYFPEAFKEFEEIIAVADVPGLYKNGKPTWGNTAIIVLRPKTGDVSIYPQDWFNKNENSDFGYEWITMASRDKATGFIRGKGIRIDDFVLDESNKTLK